MDTKWKHPFTAMISGPTSSGKSYFVRELLNNKERMIDTSLKEVVWCYGEWQKLYEKLYEEIQDVVFHKGIMKNLPSDGEPRLIIIDDLMREADGSIVDLFTKGSHHRNLSVIFITQNLFHKGKAQRDISLNAHYMIVFKNPRDAAQVNFLARQISPENPKFILEAYRDATSVPHGYLLLDLKQSTDDTLRVRTNVFDTHVTIYVPKRIKEKE
jgi:hypothetical protein